MAYIIKAIPIVLSNTSIIIFTPQLLAYALCRSYNAIVVIRQLKTWGYDAGVVNITLKDIGISEQYDARIVHTMSYFYHASHCVVIDSNVENTERRIFSTLNFRLYVRRHCNFQR